MDGQDLLSRAAARARELPASEVGQPFGDDWEVYTVSGRIFVLLTAVTGQPMVVLKAAPWDAEALRQQYPSITPGYHMNKRHWISVLPGDDVDAALLDELVTESYLQVAAKLPKRLRPLGWQL